MHLYLGQNPPFGNPAYAPGTYHNPQAYPQSALKCNDWQSREIINCARLVFECSWPGGDV